MTPPSEAANTPEEFPQVFAGLRSASVRPEVTLEERAAPRRLAPYAVAFAGRVTRDGTEAACGNFIVLHDPAGHEGWEGTFRVVTYVRAELDPEIAADPLLGGVGWSWLTEALERGGASYTAAAGTITRSASESFGAIAERLDATEVELRASWTPRGDDLGTHLEAWCEVLCTAGGLPPLPDGVAPLRSGPRW